MVDPPFTSRLRLPSVCAVCRGWGTQRVCATCSARFAPRVARCERCALAVPAGVRVCGACLTDPPPFERGIAAVDYAPPWGELIARFKFQAALDLAPVLAQRLVAAVRHAAGPRAELILPVPLSAARLRERGFNQAWELARRVARELHTPADAHLLLRVKDTPHQLALAPAQRAGNVRAAFAAEPLRRAELAGRRVALVDDVMTTGATASEIARVLLQAGAAQVQVWVVARTPRPAER
ncbi:MAG TPA: ComF family protein [Burkholderiaceae bacterium]|nr:ComF family protein [Burkholderiaceae bacterium]